eukprot:TRINITY_DN3680_c0_g2_i2.p1 TRINITY_DN3680_c0_g2~~TRINITY_DN3680_c0_g2_i2.p1  ORF type:complete len:171 (+),score=19.57 TRINITY_DN3680_c0_g2_i2:242-754(+)
MQVSTSTEDYIIDGLLLWKEIEKHLKDIFESAEVVKVFHGCDYDLSLLASNHSIYCKNIFDTARAYCILTNTANIKKKALPSLDLLIQTLIGIKMDKYFQKADWRIRPLPSAMLDYARADSHYLISLYHILASKLNERGSLVSMAVQCNELACKKVKPDHMQRIEVVINS